MADDIELGELDTAAEAGGRKAVGTRLQELLARMPLPSPDGTLPGEQDESHTRFVDLLQLHMGGGDFLLPASDVAEIVRPLPLTPVPMAPDHLLGVGNVHGQIVCVVEPGRMMSLPLPPGSNDDATRFVLLRHARMRVALRVDAVPAIHRVIDTELHNLHDSEVPKHGIRGWLEVDGKRYDMLDAKALLQD